MTPFDQHTAVTRAGDDRFTAQVHPGYAVPGGAPNGGYLTALAARALAERLGVPDPLTVTTHYLASPKATEVEILTEAIKATGRHRTGTARVLQDGHEVVRITGTFTDLAAAKGHTHVHATPPDVPPFDDCIDPTGAPLLPEVFGRTQMRLTPASLSWALGEKTGRALLEGWTALEGADHVPTLGLLFLCDAVPPPIFNLHDVPFGWMPTLELTTQVRGIPAPGPLRMRFQSNFVTDGYLEMDAELWDSQDRPVAIARQTALVPRDAR